MKEVNMATVSAHRQLHLYRSLLCPGCSSSIGNGEEDFLAQIIPVNPEVYVAYFCKTCFINAPIQEIVTQARTYLSSEDKMFREHREKQREGRFIYDPFQFLEDSIKFLRGMAKSPPFVCAIFSLHERYINGSPPTRDRAHLSLISFD